MYEKLIRPISKNISIASILQVVLWVSTSTFLTLQAVGTGTAQIGSSTPPINAIFNLSGLYIGILILLIVWLILSFFLRPGLRVLAYWAPLFLCSSYLYFQNFFLLEQGAFYPLLYVLAFGMFLFTVKEKLLSTRLIKSIFPQSQVFHAFLVFLVLLGVGVSFSSAPAESFGQYLQIGCFGLLPFLLKHDLRDERIWKLTARFILITGGWLWAALAGIKLLILVRELGLMEALQYRLYIANVGPNWIAYSLVALLPLSIGFTFYVTGRLRRIICLIGTLGMVLTLVYTQSLNGFSGWTGFILGGICFFILRKWQIIKSILLKNYIKFKLLALSGIVLLTIIGITVILNFAYQINNYSVNTRLYGWRVLLYQITDHPIVGSGPIVRYITAQYGDLVSWKDIGAQESWLAQIPLFAANYKERQLTFHTHNLFFEIAVGAGIPALLAFLWFLWKLAQHSLRASISLNGKNSILIAACIAGIVGSLGWGLLDVMENSPPFFSFPVWPLIGLLLASPYVLVVGQIPEKREKKIHIFPFHFQSRFAKNLPITFKSIVLIVSCVVAAILISYIAIIAPLAGNWHYRNAYVAFQEHRWSTAESELAKASQWEPLNSKYQEMRGQALINLSRYSDAISAYQEALSFKRDFSPYYNQLGWLYWRQGDLGQAITYFKKSVELDPLEAWQAGLHADLGIAMAAQGYAQEAIQLFKQTIEMHPTYAQSADWPFIEGQGKEFNQYLDPAYCFNLGSDLENRLLFHLNKTGYTPRMFALIPQNQLPKGCVSNAISMSSGT